MLKKVFSVVITAALITGLLAGCGGSKQQTQGTEPSTSAPSVATQEKSLEPASIKFWFPSEGEINDNYFTNAAKEFETKFPQIKVEVTKLPTAFVDVDLKLNAAIMSNDYPDVFSAYLAYIAQRGAKGEFEDITSFVDKWEDKGDIIESALEMGEYKGKQYGVGFYPSPMILCYRTDYFEEAGLDPSKPPKNWDEIRDYAYKLVKKDTSGKVTRAGYDIPAIGVENFLIPFIRQTGALHIDEANEKPVYTDKGVVEALNFMTGLKDQSIPYDGTKLDDYPFMKGNAAMSVIAVSQINKLISSDPSMKDKIGFAPVTEKAKRSNWCGYRLFTMGSTTKYKEQSWEFIKFLMSKEEMMKRAKEMNMAVLRKSLEKEFTAINPRLNAAITEYVQYGKGVSAVSWVSISTKNTRLAYEEVYTGKKSAEQALKDAEETVNKEIEALFKK